MGDLGEPLTAEQAAKELGVSSTRVRQLVSEGRLAPPMELSDRVHLWWPAEVEAARALLAGQIMSVRADLLSALPARLPRVADHLVRYLPSPALPAVVHVRIWSGAAPEGTRTVVLLGSMKESIGLQTHIEQVVTIVSERFLHGRAEDAVWLESHSSFSGKPTILNPILEYPAEPQSRDGWRGVMSRRLSARDNGTDRPAPRPHWRSSSYTELERVVGGPVEAYPDAGYTSATVEAWQMRRGRDTVDHVHDPYRLIEFAAALSKLDGVGSSDPRIAVARDACALLARECLALIDGYAAAQAWWDDGTRVGGEHVPSVWAARLVQPSLSRREHALIEGHSTTSVDESSYPALLNAIWRWSDETGRYGGQHADEQLHRALGMVEQLVNRLVGGAYRSTTVRAFDITSLEERFLNGDVAWNEIADDPTPDQRHMATQVAWLSSLNVNADPLDVVEFGVERRSHRLVARLLPHFRDLADRPAFAIQWPNYPQKEPLSNGDQIVAVNSPRRGDTPVFIAHPDGSMEPMARDPRRQHDDWNFGYSGGGPGTLAAAITRVIAESDGADAADAVAGWIDDQVRYSDQDTLTLSLRDIRRRQAP